MELLNNNKFKIIVFSNARNKIKDWYDLDIQARKNLKEKVNIENNPEIFEYAKYIGNSLCKSMFNITEEEWPTRLLTVRDWVGVVDEHGEITGGDETVEWGVVERNFFITCKNE